MVKKKKAIGKAYSVKLTANAIRNIDEITGYIAFINHQPLNAIKVGDALFDKIQRIAINPFAYKECEELPTKSKIYRQVHCLAWQIIFKVYEDQVIILGIIHHSRKPSKLKKLKKIK